MAKVSNSFSTYGAVANREALSDVIANISPSDTPFQTLAGKRNTANRSFDWQTEALKAADGNNAQEDGFVATVETSVPTVRVTNVAQISVRSASVTGSQQAANAAGKAKGEMSHQLALAAKHLKRDMETILCSNQARVDGNDSGTARKTEGLEHALKTSVNGGVGFAAAASQTATGTDGTLRSITRAILDASLVTAYNNGAEPTEMLVPPAIKQTISNFAGRQGTQVTNDVNELVTSFDVYKSDFGVIKVRPSRWIRNRTCFIIDPQYVKVAFYRNFETSDLAKTGDADSKMITVEYGLDFGNEAAHIKIADVQA